VERVAAGAGGHRREPEDALPQAQLLEVPGQEVVEIRGGADAHIAGEMVGQQPEREGRVVGAQERQNAPVLEQRAVLERAGKTGHGCSLLVTIGAPDGCGALRRDAAPGLRSRADGWAVRGWDGAGRAPHHVLIFYSGLQ